jgi:2-oxoisovalerate dehydrogenase E1 component beta subunit
MVYTADEAAEQLDRDGVSVEVIDLRTVMPWDKDAVLESVRKTSKVLVLHEDTRTGGFGAEIAATIAEEAMFDLDAPVVRIGGPDIPAMPYAAALEHFYTEPTPDHLYRAMRDLARF